MAPLLNTSNLPAIPGDLKMAELILVQHGQFRKRFEKILSSDPCLVQVESAIDFSMNPNVGWIVTWQGIAGPAMPYLSIAF